MLAELIGFVGHISRIWQLELIGFADWIGHFLPGFLAVFRGVTKMKNKGQRQYQQTMALKSGISLFSRG